MTAARGVRLLIVVLFCQGIPTALAATSDARITLNARRALFTDPELAACNLGVSVRGGVATLLGVVPTAELARRAAECVRRIDGVRDVQSDLSVVHPAEDPSRPRSRPPAASLTAAPQPEPREQPPSGEAIVLAVERLRRLDKRYQGLRAELHGRVVVLRGDVVRGEDAMDLARAVSRLEGVERVVLQQIRNRRVP